MPRLAFGLLMSSHTIGIGRRWQASCIHQNVAFREPNLSINKAITKGPIEGHQHIGMTSVSYNDLALRLDSGGQLVRAIPSALVKSSYPFDLLHEYTASELPKREVTCQAISYFSRTGSSRLFRTKVPGYDHDGPSSNDKRRNSLLVHRSVDEEVYNTRQNALQLFYPELITMPSFTVLAIGALALAGNALGACTNPAVRKEYRTLTVAEKTEFVRAINCLSSLPHGTKLTKTRIAGGISLINGTSSLYDDWVYLHMDSNVKTHVTALFFPWHRWYIDAFEKEMKDKCQFKGTIPYWDFTKDAADFSKSPIFDANPTYGIGTWGTAANDWVIKDGAFSKAIRAYPVPHIIRRQWTPQPFRINYIFPFEYPNKDKWANETASPAAINTLIESFEGDFNAFGAAVEGPRAQGLHNAVHLSMGGDMSDPSPTPSDPLFWIYHAQLDRIWAKWQARRPANARSFSGGTVQVLDRFDEFPTGMPWPPATTKDLLPVSGMETADVPVEQVMSTTGNFTDRYTKFTGGRLCYTYDDML